MKKCGYIYNIYFIPELILHRYLNIEKVNFQLQKICMDKKNLSISHIIL
jgi:hypothetical protein